VALAKLQNQFDQSERRAQAEIEHSEFVTRAHFDTEFEAMKQVFEYLSQVKLTMNGLRPTDVQIGFGSEQEKEADLAQRFQMFRIPFNKLVAESEAKEPFYTAELYAAVDECIRAGTAEFKSLLRGDEPFTDDWYEEGERHRNRFGKGYRMAVNIIRDRIASLAILPSP